MRMKALPVEWPLVTGVTFNDGSNLQCREYSSSSLNALATAEAAPPNQQNRFAHWSQWLSTGPTLAMQSKGEVALSFILSFRLL